MGTVSNSVGARHCAFSIRFRADSVVAAIIEASLRRRYPNCQTHLCQDAEEVAVDEVRICLEGTDRCLSVQSVIDERPVRTLVAAGMSVITLGARTEEFDAAVQALIDGWTFVSGAVAQALAGAQKNGPVVLTPREREVVNLLRRGHSNREIAVALLISPSTVRQHLQSIAGKLAVSSRVKIVRVADELGL